MRVNVGSLEDLVENTPYKILVEDYPILLVKVKSRVYAVSATCTHMGCSLQDGTVEDLEITCPCHGAKFNLESGESITPNLTSKPLETFKVEIEEGKVYLILPD